MRIEFSEATIALTGRKMTNGHEWVTVVTHFQDQELDCCPQIEVKCPVRSDDSRSIAEAQTEAIAYAVQLLRQTADLLEQRELAELLRLQE
jgi:hypothetical protein